MQPFPKYIRLNAVSKEEYNRDYALLEPLREALRHQSIKEREAYNKVKEFNSPVGFSPEQISKEYWRLTDLAFEEERKYKAIAHDFNKKASEFNAKYKNIIWEG